MDATEEAGGPPQRKDAPLPAADLTARGPPRAETPSGVTSQPNKQHASGPANHRPDITTRKSSEAPDAGQPGTEPGRPTPNAEHAAAPPPNQPPTGHRPRDTRTPPNQRPQQAAATQARRGTPRPGRRRQGAQLKPTRIPRPGQPDPTRPSATKTLSTPSWSPTGGPATQTQSRMPCATSRSHEATIQGAHPSKCPARHTSSAIKAPWGRELNTPQPRITGARPLAGQQTRPRTNHPGTAPKGAERWWTRAPTPLASLPTSRRGPPHPGGVGI